MSVVKETYQNKTIEIQNNEKLLIDNKPIQLSFDHETGRWATHMIPYKQYDDLMTLAKQLIADTEEFR